MQSVDDSIHDEAVGSMTRTLLVILFALIGVYVFVVSQGHAEKFKRSERLQVNYFTSIKTTPQTKNFRPLRVMSFNVAHGSNNPFGVVPLFTGTKTIKKRLRTMAQFINKKHPDVVGFQEADGPSWWSGGFHHVDYIARHAGYPFSALGIHVKTKSKRYGTALISRRRLHHGITYRFKPLTMFKKGFVLASVRWPGRASLFVDIVSLHLDPQSQTTQKSQLKELVKVLKKRNRPVVVMGDFNTTWNHDTSPLLVLTQGLKLHTFQQNNSHLYTHRFPTKRRIDWIYISKQLRFSTHTVIQRRLTDHNPVMADIAYRIPKQATSKVKSKTIKPKSRMKPASLLTIPTKQYTHWLSLPTQARKRSLEKKPTKRP